MSLSNNKSKILELIDNLKNFPNTSTVKRLRRELQSQLKSAEITTTKKIKKAAKKAKIALEANVTRASKGRKYHNYIKLLQERFPQFTYKDVKTMFKDRTAGKEVSVPDDFFDAQSP